MSVSVEQVYGLLGPLGPLDCGEGRRANNKSLLAEYGH